MPESSVVRSRYVRVYHPNRLDVLEALMEFIVEDANDWTILSNQR
ncbi:hypothetical protein ACNKHM_18780 [Shigella sonnei]